MLPGMGGREEGTTSKSLGECDQAESAREARGNNEQDRPQRRRNLEPEEPPRDEREQLNARDEVGDQQIAMLDAEVDEWQPGPAILAPDLEEARTGTSRAIVAPYSPPCTD